MDPRSPEINPVITLDPKDLLVYQNQHNDETHPHSSLDYPSGSLIRSVGVTPRQRAIHRSSAR